jgi:IS1 family transposase
MGDLWGDLCPMMKGDLIPTVSKDKKDVYILTYIHKSPKDGNSSVECSNALKSANIKDYNRKMGFVDKSDRMACYSI